MSIRRHINFSSDQETNNSSRTFVTNVVIGAGLFIIVFLSCLTIYVGSSTEEPFEATQMVFNAVIPLIGTWIGAVIAFYFGRDNYDAAAQQVMALTRETLDDINVENIMIHTKTIVTQKIDEVSEKDVKIADLITLYKKVEKDRIPVFSSNSVPRYIIHLDFMEKYREENKAISDDDLKLEKLLNDHPKKFKDQEEMGFVTLSRDNTVSDALKKMKEVANCRDVFITHDGKASGRVLGWLTDSLIDRFLDVRS